MISEVRRPPDDDVLPITACLAWQEDYCRSLGSPVAAEILRAVRLDVSAGGALASALPRSARFGDLLGLRVLAAMHRLALDDQAPGVAAFMPTVGGVGPGRDARAIAKLDSAVREALQSSPAVVNDYLARVPQTNEVGRSRLLRHALSTLEGPVRLLEIGASAGLNLRVDHLAGDPVLEAGPLPPIVERLGCDLSPIDPSTPHGAARLSSYVWADDLERFRALHAAIEVARRVPVTVRRQDAAEFVEAMTLEPGATTVLWHSAVWVYLPTGHRDRISAALEALGATATPHQPLHHVCWERQHGGHSRHSLTVRTWNGRSAPARARTLLTGTSHGTDVA